MKPFCLLILLLLPFVVKTQTREEWIAELKPFRIADNLYYVGSRDLAVYLITTKEGNILINANVQESPPLIRKSVEALGFSWKDIRIVLNGQAHLDHVGGMQQVLDETGAEAYVMDGDVEVMESGGQTDFAYGPDQQFPRTKVSRVLHDGDEIRLGEVVIAARKTAGHTQGCTTFTMQVHLPGEPADRLRHVVIAGGMTALSNYRLVDKPDHPASYPGIAEDFRKTYALMRALPCDIYLGAHGSYFDMLEKLKRMRKEGNSVWIDPKGYQQKIDSYESEFKKLLEAQSKE